jgi:hypothetical protein
MKKVIITARYGFPDFVLPCLTKLSIEPNISSSASALRTRELPIRQESSPENVVDNIPIGTSGAQKLIDCNT